MVKICKVHELISNLDVDEYKCERDPLLSAIKAHHTRTVGNIKLKIPLSNLERLTKPCIFLVKGRVKS